LALLISLATEYTSKAIGTNAAVPVALTDGFRLAYVIGAGFVIAAAAVTFVFGRNSSPVPAAPRSRMAAAVVLIVALFAGRTLGRPAPGARP